MKEINASETLHRVPNTQHTQEIILSAWLATATQIGFIFVKMINCFLHILKHSKKKSLLFN